MDFHSRVDDLWSPDSEAHTLSELPPSIVSRSDRPPSPWQWCKRPLLHSVMMEGLPGLVQHCQGKEACHFLRNSTCLRSQTIPSRFQTDVVCIFHAQVCWSRKKWHHPHSIALCYVSGRFQTLLSSYKAACLGDFKGFGACHLHYRFQSWPVGCNSSHGCCLGGTWTSVLVAEIEWALLCSTPLCLLLVISLTSLLGDFQCKLGVPLHRITHLGPLVSTAAKNVALFDTWRSKYL